MASNDGEKDETELICISQKVINIPNILSPNSFSTLKKLVLAHNLIEEIAIFDHQTFMSCLLYNMDHATM